MERRINIHDPSVTIPAVVDQVRRGDELILWDGDQPVARIIPIAAPRAQRVPGLNRGAVTIEPDFDDPLPADFWVGQA